MDMRLGVIFDSGGFAGSYGVGYAKSLWASGLRPIVCQGVSVGALTGAGLVEECGNPDKVEKIWLKTERDGPQAIFPTMDIPRRIFKTSLFSNKGIYRLAENINYRRLVESAVRFDAVVYNETTNRQELFSSHNPSHRENTSILRDAIVASCSLRGFLEPIPIGGQWYSDGLVFLIKPLVQFGCDTVFVFLNEIATGPADTRSIYRDRKWWLSRLIAGAHSMNTLLAEKELAAAENTNHDLAALSGVAEEFDRLGATRRFFLKKALSRFRFTFEGRQPVKIVYFRPTVSTPSLWALGFEPGDITRAIRHGYDTGMRTIEKFLSSPL